MKAIVYERYGSPEVLALREVEAPVAGEGELLVKVHAASVNWLDWHFLTGKPFLVRLMAGVLRPKHSVLGIDVAGQVEALGEGVARFQPGDEVFAAGDHGCFAEYVCLKQDQVQHKPANVTFEAAAAVGAAASTALHALRDAGGIEHGQKVLINGASGGVGTFAVQLARTFGVEVTGVCSPNNREMLLDIGADHVVDYTRQDFTQLGERYDLIFDAVATRTYAQCRMALTPRGVYVTSAFTPGLALQGLWTSFNGPRKLSPLAPRPPSTDDLRYLRELLESGAIRPVIDHCYPLDELAQALNTLAKGHTRGKIIIRV